MHNINIAELLMNINEIKLIVISAFVLALVSLLVILFKPVLKDILHIFISKFRNKDGKD
ncbi:BlyA family holin [Candidatus Borreliella tachyglossi]|uniref:BlyA family holin n=1 Tax=Candidatus Borreliella tachyglossi TaxID=1964448 RepID=UPI004042229B